jgi:transcriptional regulator with XRE-family HTH domain
MRGYQKAPRQKFASLAAGEGPVAGAVCIHAKIHRTYISDLERGARDPTITIIAKLAETLGVKAGRLLD